MSGGGVTYAGLGTELMEMVVLPGLASRNVSALSAVNCSPAGTSAEPVIAPCSSRSVPTAGFETSSCGGMYPHAPTKQPPGARRASSLAATRPVTPSTRFTPSPSATDDDAPPPNESPGESTNAAGSIRTGTVMPTYPGLVTSTKLESPVQQEACTYALLTGLATKLVSDCVPVTLGSSVSATEGPALHLSVGKPTVGSFGTNDVTSDINGLSSCVPTGNTSSRGSSSRPMTPRGWMISSVSSLACAPPAPVTTRRTR